MRMKATLLLVPATCTDYVCQHSLSICLAAGLLFIYWHLPRWWVKWSPLSSKGLQGAGACKDFFE